MTAEGIAKEILSLKSVYILVHSNPDGDALGSGFGLCEFLRSRGITADVVLEKPVPGLYEFMEVSPVLVDEAKEQRDVIVLDCGEPDRVGTCAHLLQGAKHTVVVDHHGTNEGFGEFCLVIPDFSSTAEIIFDIIKAAEGEITGRIAFLLYGAIMSDTGRLSYSCASPDTARAVAELMETGIDFPYINRMLFENNPPERLKLKGLVTESLRLALDGKAAVIHVSREMLEKTGTCEDDAEGFVNIARGVKGVEVGVFLKEREGEIRIGLRSNAYADVSRVAKEMGGGGHIHASGCTFNGSMEEAEKRVLELVEQVL